MYVNSSEIAPVLRRNANNQASYLGGLSKSMLHTMGSVCALNMRFAGDLFEEASLVNKEVLSIDRPSHYLFTMVSGLRVLNSKIYVYMRDMKRLAGDARADLTQLASGHALQAADSSGVAIDDTAPGEAREVADVEETVEGAEQDVTAPPFNATMRTEHPDVGANGRTM